MRTRHIHAKPDEFIRVHRSRRAAPQARPYVPPKAPVSSPAPASSFDWDIVLYVGIGLVSLFIIYIIMQYWWVILLMVLCAGAAKK